MSQSRTAYPPEFRRQMVELVQARLHVAASVPMGQRHGLFWPVPQLWGGAPQSLLESEPPVKTSIVTVGFGCPSAPACAAPPPHGLNCSGVPQFSGRRGRATYRL
jgi:hypothetical protein